MKKFISSILLCTAMQPCLGDDLVAVVDLKFVRDTDETAAQVCFDQARTDCEALATFYLFDAKVRKVIQGGFEDRRFRVKFGRHGLQKSNFKEIVALLEPLPAGDEAEFKILEIGEEKEMYCFSADANKLYTVSMESGGPDLKCFEGED